MGDGLRAAKHFGGSAYFLYDGDEPVCELDGSGAVLAVHTFGPNGLLARRINGATTFYTFDPSGNTAQRVNSGGGVIGSGSVDAFGNVTTTDGTGDPYGGFGAQWGYYYDAQTGLSLLGHRYYDSATGRFLTRDPMGYDGGVNLYGYTANDPVNFNDPSGFGENDGIVRNETNGIQYGLGGFDPGKYHQRPGGPPFYIDPNKPRRAPSYPVFPINGPPGDNYIFPVPPGGSVGGQGVDIDAGWDKGSKCWVKTPGSPTLHTPFGPVEIPNSGLWLPPIQSGSGPHIPGGFYPGFGPGAGSEFGGHNAYPDPHTVVHPPPRRH